MTVLDTKNYNVILNIPDDIKFAFNDIAIHNIFNIEEYIQNLYIPDEHSLIVLWGTGSRISVTDRRIIKLNEFYHNIKNPMILFNGGIYTDLHNFTDFVNVEFSLFRYISKISQRPNRPINLSKTKKFIFASTKDYPVRRYILQTLINNNFADQGYVAYKCLVSSTTVDYFDNENLKIINDAGDSINNLLPIRGFDDIPNYAAVPENIIANTYLSIITETFFTSPILISEKIFNAMMYNHVFIYVGPVYGLAYLKSLGFKTFGNIINEDYDNIEDNAQRLYAVTTEINNFLNKSLSEIQELYEQNLDIINHNRNLVENTEINEFVVTAMRQAIAAKT